MSDTTHTSDDCSNDCDQTPGIISWNELATSASDDSFSFYSQLFGWTKAPAPGAEGYNMLMAGDKMVAGLYDKSEHCDGPSVWLPYITVENLETSLAKAIELGGKDLKGITEVEGMGRFAIVEDPQEGKVGLWQFVNPTDG